MAKGIPGTHIFGSNPSLSSVDTTGEVFWVGSTAVSGGVAGKDNAGNRGNNAQTPFATVDYAINQCAAGRVDTIVGLPGHAETISAAAGAVFDVAGVRLIGLGEGSLRPTITFDTAVGADIDIDAAGVMIENILFLGGVDALTGPIDVNAADFTLKNCEWRDSTGQVTDCIVTDANADRMLIDGLRYVGSLTAGSSASGTNVGVVLVGCDNPVIRNSTFIGRFGIAAIECRTTAVVMLECYDCKFIQLDNQAAGTAGTWIEDTITASTGLIGPNVLGHIQTGGATITEAITGATFRILNPVEVVNTDDEKALTINWTASGDT